MRDIENGNNRSQQIVRASITGVVANILLALFKALIGLAVNSAAILTDAINNLSDVLSSTITIVGTKLASRPPDKEHPYGHGKAEYIGSVLVALIILYSAIQAFLDGLHAVMTSSETHYDVLSIVIVAASVVVKIFLGRYLQKKGRAVHSESLIGSGTDALFDALASLSILVSAILSLLLHIDIDGWLAMAIAALILRAGIDILRNSIDSILGTRISGAYAQEIKKVISNFSGVLGCYDLILNGYGPNMTIGSVHVTVPDNLHARDIDTLSRKIQHDMYHNYGIIMTVGIYAANDSDPLSISMHELAQQIADKYPEVLQLHGFYANPRTKHASLDIIVDFAADTGPEIKKELLNTLQKKYTDYTFHVTLDRDFSD